MVNKSPPSPSMRVAVSHAACTRSFPTTHTSPLINPKTSPAAHSPANVRNGRLATASVAYLACATASVISPSTASKPLLSSCSAIAARDCTGEREGSTAARAPSSRITMSASSAVDLPALSCGSNSTSSAPSAASIHSSTPTRRDSNAAMTVTPEASSTSCKPGPFATVITRLVPLATKDASVVMRTRWTTPAFIPASTAAPAASVCTCTFHVGTSPTTKTLEPRASRSARNFATFSTSLDASKYITSYSPSDSPSQAVTLAGVKVIPSSGDDDGSSTSTSAARMRSSACAPASITPAASGTGGFNAESIAARCAPLQAARATSTLFFSSHRSANSAAEEIAVRMVPGKGLTTASHAFFRAAQSAATKPESNSAAMPAKI